MLLDPTITAEDIRRTGKFAPGSVVIDTRTGQARNVATKEAFAENLSYDPASSGSSSAPDFTI